MKPAYQHLIRFALARGCTVSVWDGEEWQVKRCHAYKQIVDAIQSVEEAQLRIRDQDGKAIAWALVSAYGLEPDETVVDNTMNEFMTEWDEAYAAA